MLTWEGGMSTSEVETISLGRKEEGKKQRTMREELAEHECMIRLRVITRDTDVLIHIESDNMFESDQLVR
jgi:hypothetical protein